MTLFQTGFEHCPLGAQLQLLFSIKKVLDEEKNRQKRK